MTNVLLSAAILHTCNVSTSCTSKGIIFCISYHTKSMSLFFCLINKIAIFIRLHNIQHARNEANKKFAELGGGVSLIGYVKSMFNLFFIFGINKECNLLLDFSS